MRGRRPRFRTALRVAAGALTLLVVALAWAAPSTAHAAPQGPYLPDHVWPLSGTTAPDFDAYGIAATFGPRVLASADLRYDFHRGIDIPCECDTPVHASADGVIRLAGDYSFYANRLVQIRHYKPGADGSCTNAAGEKTGCYYSNYMNLASVAVNPATGAPYRNGDPVSAGDVIGYSGESGIGASGVCNAGTGGFDHLHFENPRRRRLPAARDPSPRRAAVSRYGCEHAPGRCHEHRRHRPAPSRSRRDCGAPTVRGARSRAGGGGRLRQRERHPTTGGPACLRRARVERPVLGERPGRPGVQRRPGPAGPVQRPERALRGRVHLLRFAGGGERRPPRRGRPRHGYLGECHRGAPRPCLADLRDDDARLRRVRDRLHLWAPLAGV